jgi:hypothetical protein
VDRDREAAFTGKAERRREGNRNHPEPGKSATPRSPPLPGRT